MPFPGGDAGKYVGRLHGLHENRSEVQVFDHIDANVAMLARSLREDRRVM